MLKRPALRYHGGKFRLAPWIIENLPVHKAYIEPFGGGASVLLRKAPSKLDVYNDLNEAIVDVFRVLRDPCQSARLTGLLELTPVAREEFIDAYAHSDDLVERVRRTIVRSFFGQGSGATFGEATAFRHRKHDDGSMVNEWKTYQQALPRFTQRMTSVVIENLPSERLISQYDQVGACFYIDPPYVISTRNSRHRYPCEFTEADHVALGEQLQTLKASCVVSGYTTPAYEAMYRDWKRVVRQSQTDRGGEREEVLWIKDRS